MKRFNRKEYRKNLDSVELYNTWIEKYPEFAGYDIRFFKKNLKKFVKAAVDTIVDNPHGFTVFRMGNFGIKVLDIDFKCAEDFNKTIRPYGQERKDSTEAVPFVTIENPKRMKVAWTKDRTSASELSLMGMEMTTGMRLSIGPRLKGRHKFYPKVGATVESSCEPVKEKSIFDAA